MNKKVKELEEQLESSRRFADSLYKELKELRIRYYTPISKDKKIKEEAVDFGKFLITMNVQAVIYPTGFKTNCGLAPDMIVETMEAMYDRYIQAKIPFHFEGEKEE